MNVERAWETCRQQDVFTDWTPRKTDAVLRMVLLASTADDLLTYREIEALADELVRVPALSSPKLEQLRGPEGLDLHERIRRRLDDPQALGRYVDTIRRDLQDEQTALASLHMTAMILADTDEPEDQMELCVELGRLFGFPREQITNYLCAAVDPSRRV